VPQRPESIESYLRPKNVRQTVFWRLAEDIPASLNKALTIASIAIPLVLWWLVTTLGNVDPKFLPSPGQVIEAFGRLWSSGELLRDTVASLWRVGVGFSLAALLSIPVD
jgi:NitT/TauT family transport system permease protein